MSLAQEIQSALAEAGVSVSGAPLVCSLRKRTGAQGTPWDETPAAYSLSDLTAIQSVERVRDQAGTLTGEARRTLTVDAVGEAPGKGDGLAVGIASADVTEDTPFAEIIEVRPLAPAGVSLMYELDLAQ